MSLFKYLNLTQLSIGCHDINEKIYMNVVEQETVATESKQAELHRQYIDIGVIDKFVAKKWLKTL
ncbi:MAG: YhcH/YjgK/YiaL family protein [[Pasteurella] aerogenes]|nr:YhcH/YjgK/YiaL family protein [[Pasteurella] aerogenes]